MCHCNWSIMVLQSCPCLRTIVSRPAHSPGYNISSKCLPQIGPGLTCLKKQGSHYCMCLIVDFHIGRWRGTEVVSLQPTRPPNCRPLSSSQQWMRICKDVWGYYFFFCLWLFFTGSLRPSPSVIEPTKTLLSPIMDVFLTLTRDFFLWENPNRSTEKWYTNNEGKTRNTRRFFLVMSECICQWNKGKLSKIKSNVAHWNYNFRAIVSYIRCDETVCVEIRQRYRVRLRFCSVVTREKLKIEPKRNVQF